MSEVNVPVLDIRAGDTLCPYGYQDPHREDVTQAFSPEQGLWSIVSQDRAGVVRQYSWAVDDVTNVAFICDRADA